MKRLLAAVLAAVFVLCGCENAGPADSSSEPEGAGGSTVRDAVHSTELQFAEPEYGAPVAVVETSRGTVRFVLYPHLAPLAVENFITLAESGYYDGTLVHRVVADFAVQAGDATGTGHGGESMWGGAFATERSDALRHYSGALCMAPEAGMPDSHKSQFYVVATPQDVLDEAALERLRAAGVREGVVEAYRQAGGAPYLDNTDTVFGQVIAGMDVIDDIARLSVDENERPKREVEIIRVTITTYTEGAPPVQSVPDVSLPLPGADADGSGSDGTSGAA